MFDLDSERERDRTYFANFEGFLDVGKSVVDHALLTEEVEIVNVPCDYDEVGGCAFVDDARVCCGLRVAVGDHVFYVDAVPEAAGLSKAVQSFQKFPDAVGAVFVSGGLCHICRF